MKRWLVSALLCACGDDSSARDLAVADFGADLAVADLAADAANAPDLSGGADGGGCVATLGPTHLYENPCTSGGIICFFDHPPTTFF